MDTKMIEINTDHMQPPTVGSDLFRNRSAATAMQQISCLADVSVVIIAYNRLEKTRRCVESVLQYTTGINYELILVDNGSTDRTLEYFQSVSYDKKQIIHITKNLGAAYPYFILNLNNLGEFVCMLANDIIVTQDRKSVV